MPEMVSVNKGAPGVCTALARLQKPPSKEKFPPLILPVSCCPIVPLKEWLPDTMLQAIAAENNLAETAFFLPRGTACRCALQKY